MNQQEIDATIDNFRNILNKHMPVDFGYRYVRFEKSTFSNRIIISFAPSFQIISNVKRHHPHRVSLWLNTDTLEFETINLGGMGERSLWLTTQTNYSTDRYNIPFRKPKKNLTNIFSAFDKFCERYVEGLRFCLPTLAYKSMLSPVANKMLGLPLYEVDENIENVSIHSSDEHMLTFLSICLAEHKPEKYCFTFPSKLLGQVKQYIELWYEAEAEAAKLKESILQDAKNNLDTLSSELSQKMS